MIQDRVDSEALRLVRIVGRATLTIVASSSDMNIPMSSTPSARQARRGGGLGQGQESFRETELRAGLVSPIAALCTGVTLNDSAALTLNDIPLVTIDGETTSLAQYSDKVKLIVNVASRCGLTPQYKQLEELQKTYGGRGFTVLGFPSNQFLQELGSSAAIQTFCSTTYGVTFPMFEKVKVNGRSRPVSYTHL